MAYHSYFFVTFWTDPIIFIRPYYLFNWRIFVNTVKTKYIIIFICRKLSVFIKWVFNKNIFSKSLIIYWIFILCFFIGADLFGISLLQEIDNKSHNNSQSYADSSNYVIMNTLNEIKNTLHLLTGVTIAMCIAWLIYTFILKPNTSFSRSGISGHFAF